MIVAPGTLIRACDSPLCLARDAETISIKCRHCGEQTGPARVSTGPSATPILPEPHAHILRMAFVFGAYRARGSHILVCKQLFAAGLLRRTGFATFLLTRVGRRWVELDGDWVAAPAAPTSKPTVFEEHDRAAAIAAGWDPNGCCGGWGCVGLC
jgi:hypothetical protein